MTDLTLLDGIGLRTRFSVDFNTLLGLLQTDHFDKLTSELQSAGFGALAAVLDKQGAPGPKGPSRWEKGRLLGQGGFGKVYLCTDLDNGRQMAVKEVTMNPNSGEEVQALRVEIELLRVLKHERIVQYYGTEETARIISIFIEYMPNGSIRDLIERNGAFSASDTRKFTRQILEGLAYLHGLSVVHRDIKGANVLCDKSGCIKLADFGLAKRLTNVSVGAQTFGVGTTRWTAPEVWKGVPYGISVDIWSLGCTIVEMLTTGPPAYNPSTGPQYKLPAGAPASTNDILGRCLQVDPQSRPTAEALLRDPFCQ